MNYANDLSQSTAELHNLIMAHPKVREHPKGHSQYVLRYRTDEGLEFAVEKRVHTPKLYFNRAVADGRINDLNPEWWPAGKGRNSNLNSLETFRGKPLARLPIASLEVARKALAACLD